MLNKLLPESQDGPLRLWPISVVFEDAIIFTISYESFCFGLQSRSLFATQTLFSLQINTKCSLSSLRFQGVRLGLNLMQRWTRMIWNENKCGFDFNEDWFNATDEVFIIRSW